MKKLKLIGMKVLLISTFIFLCACLDKTGQEFIYIMNKSNKKITVDFSKNKQDTTFYCSKTGRTILFTVKSNSTFELNDGDTYSGWDTNLELLTVFILDGELYEKYWQQPCDTIRKYVPVLQRYQLTSDNLQQLNWTVPYPPTEDMKDMKMYPPYRGK